MKKIGEYTVRGRISESDGVHRITLDDGRFDTGYKLVKFDIGPSNVSQATQDTYASKITTEEITGTYSDIANSWDWSDMREIGWAMVSIDMAAPVGAEWSSRIDPDNLIIQDCFIYFNEEANNEMNYMLHFEKYDITDWQGALAMVRNSSQNVN